MTRRLRRQLMICMMDVAVYWVVAVSCIWLKNTAGDAGFQKDRLGLLLGQLVLLSFCLQAALWLTRTYENLWRYAGAREYLALTAGGLLGGLAYLAPALAFFGDDRLSVTFTALICCATLLVMLSARFIYSLWHKKRGVLRKTDNERVRVGIIGAGSAGIELLGEMLDSRFGAYEPVCFFDDSPGKIGGRVRNIPIYGPIEELPRLVQGKRIDELVIAAPALNSVRRREIIELCSALHFKVRILADTLGYIQQDGRGNFISALRDIRIEDLLDRPKVVLNDAEVGGMLAGKVVLVTGGGGSIGSEICRQAAERSPRRLILLDVYENNAYQVQQELRRRFGDNLDLAVEIASVRDRAKLEYIFEKYRPQVVFHAAAHKHVPLMEDCPDEAVKNNIFGTLNAVRAADRFHAERFVLISTDKAVNPASVMGATKRVCEMIMQTYSRGSYTRFAAVRFGNVLGSHGSVVPLFQGQILSGGPVTVTHPEMTRFFMTIPEATALVLQASAYAREGEIFILDMGRPVKILTIAEKLIRLSGYVPYQDIEIRFTGLRPGEKLHEELLLAGEETYGTENRLIRIGKRIDFDESVFADRLLELEAKACDPQVDFRRELGRLVPNFRAPGQNEKRSAAAVP